MLTIIKIVFEKRTMENGPEMESTLEPTIIICDMLPIILLKGKCNSPTNRKEIQESIFYLGTLFIAKCTLSSIIDCANLMSEN